MHFPVLTVLATTLLAGVGHAADPQYMKPTSVFATWMSSTKCGNSTSNILSGQGDILPKDCGTILSDWNSNPFTVIASNWVNSTGDADLGDVDLKAVVNGSVNANGGAQFMQPVEGVFGCETQAGQVAVVEWTVRKAPNANPTGRATM